MSAQHLVTFGYCWSLIRVVSYCVILKIWEFRQQIQEDKYSDEFFNEERFTFLLDVFLLAVWLSFARYVFLDNYSSCTF